MKLVQLFEAKDKKQSFTAKAFASKITKYIKDHGGVGRIGHFQKPTQLSDDEYLYALFAGVKGGNDLYKDGTWQVKESLMKIANELEYFQKIIKNGGPKIMDELPTDCRETFKKLVTDATFLNKIIKIKEWNDVASKALVYKEEVEKVLMDEFEMEMW